MEDECEEREQRLHDARMARKAAEAAELARLKNVNAELLAACEAFLIANDLGGYEFESNEPKVYDAIRAAVAKAHGT